MGAAHGVEEDRREVAGRLSGSTVMLTSQAGQLQFCDSYRQGGVQVEYRRTGATGQFKSSRCMGWDGAELSPVGRLRVLHHLRECQQEVDC